MSSTRSLHCISSQLQLLSVTIIILSVASSSLSAPTPRPSPPSHSPSPVGKAARGQDILTDISDKVTPCEIHTIPQSDPNDKEMALCIANDYYHEAQRLENQLNCTNSTHVDKCTKLNALRIVAETLRNQMCMLINYTHSCDGHQLAEMCLSRKNPVLKNILGNITDWAIDEHYNRAHWLDDYIHTSSERDAVREILQQDKEAC